MTLLRCLVQPCLDYCSQLWSPSDQGCISRLEAVQHSFVSRIWVPELEQQDYWGKLELLRLYSEERRRERYIVCFLWKLSFGLISGYNVKWQRSDRRGLYAVPTPPNRGASAAVRLAIERCQSGEPEYSTCSRPASVTRRVTLTSSRTTWISSCPGCRTSRLRQALPGPWQPTVWLTNSLYSTTNILHTLLISHIGVGNHGSAMGRLAP